MKTPDWIEYEPGFMGQRAVLERPSILIRKPASHRGNDKLASLLGYRPHSYRARSGKGCREAYYAFLPADDAQRAFAAKLATRTRGLTRADLHSCWNQPDPFRGLPPKDETCAHPPRRLFSWFVPARNTESGEADVLCVACCECGKVLAGAA